MSRISKKDLERSIDNHLHKRLKQDFYDVEETNVSSLLSWNRLDLAFKLFYLDNINLIPKLATTIYEEDIRAQTLGDFVEKGNEQIKYDFNKYRQVFNDLYNDIHQNGFDASKSIVPLAIDGTILNGAHRVASAIKATKTVKTIKTEISNVVCNYNYFFERKISLDVLDLVVSKFIEYSDNTYIAFLWPSGKGSKNEVESMFSKVVYKRDIKLNSNGAFNLLYELYKHMDWIGSYKNGFEGIKRKLIECFPNFNTFTVLVFQADNIEKVRKIKEDIRNIYKIGFSSIHITDNKEEAVNVSRLLFNKNGRHFLNYAFPMKFENTRETLSKVTNFLYENKISKNNFLVDGSMTLSVYGLRKSSDVDYLIADDLRIEKQFSGFENHDSELAYHEECKNDLIYNPRFHFYYCTVKFIAFEQLYRMKINRNEKKDKNDSHLMEAFITKDNFKFRIINIKQQIVYLRLKIFRTIHDNGIVILKTLQIYKPLQKLYWKYILKRD